MHRRKLLEVPLVAARLILHLVVAVPAMLPELPTEKWMVPGSDGRCSADSANWKSQGFPVDFLGPSIEHMRVFGQEPWLVNQQNQPVKPKIEHLTLELKQPRRFAQQS